MKLYLSSSGLGNNTQELENWIGKHGNKLALIPNAMDIYEDSERKTMNISKDVEDLTLILGFDVNVISLKDYFGNNEKLEQDLQQYHTFFAIGGNVFVLRKAMQLSGFDTFLKKKTNSDEYLYGGYSAGICVLSPDLHGFDLVDTPINLYNHDEVLYNGIELLNYMPIPHYNPNSIEFNEIENVVKYCKNNNIKYKTLKDGDAIVEDIGKKIDDFER